MSPAKRISRIQILTSIVCTCLIVTLVIGVYKLDNLKRPDHFFYDLHMKWRGPLETTGTVVLVLMDEKSAAELNKSRGPWSRRQLADALNHLCAAGAEIIGLDMMLSAPDRQSSDDGNLARAIYDCNNVILARSTARRQISTTARRPS